MLKLSLIFFGILLFFSSNLQAQFYFFGRNKVQYEEFDWKIIETEHFNIYYYGEFKEIAEIGADYAEKAFDKLKVKFNFYINRKIPLIFYNSHIHFQQTNVLSGFIPEGVGGFFEFLKGRVVIPYLGSIKQFEHVIYHELVHVFMMGKVSYVLREHRVTTNKYPPLWFVEGLAEYWSYHWDTQAELVLRDAVLNNYFIPLEDMVRFSGGFLMYKQGQKFFEFISKNYGEDKVLQFLENVWRFSKFKDVIEFTLDESITDVSNKWTYQLKQEYYPLYSQSKPHHINSKKITNTGFNFSPRYVYGNQGGSIYFVGNYDGYTSLFKLKYDSLATEQDDPEIILKGERESLFESFHLFQPSIDAKGNTLVFITKSKNSDAIHLFDLDEDEVVKSFQYEKLISIKSPHLSKDAERVLFSATDRKGFNDLYVLNLKSESLIRLTDDYYDDKDAIFNKDETKIIFVSDRTSGDFEKTYNLFEYDVEQKNIQQLINVNANIGMPRYSPDYKTLYFTCDYDGTLNVWRLLVSDGEEPRTIQQVTNYLTSVWDFSFVTNNRIITTGFEKFSFHFYDTKIPCDNDTILFAEVELDQNNIDSSWKAISYNNHDRPEHLEYTNEYTLDYAFSQVTTDPVFGTRGGAIFSLSDLLGDDRYIFLISNSAQVQSEFFKSFNVAITRINLKNRYNFGYGVFHFSGLRYDLRESNTRFYERIFGGSFSLSYPLSSFDRIETSFTVANSDKDLDDTVFPRKALILSGLISYVSDNSIWGRTGPIDGSRFRALAGYSKDIKNHTTDYYTLILDYRHYLRLSRRSTLAARAAIFYNDGQEARRFIAGGSWDLRGWNRWSLRGQKLWVGSLELRYPFVDQVAIRFPFFGLSFTSIRGALFFDAGSVWDKKYKETIGSVGAGVRFNLFNIITFRYDIGKKIENNFKTFQSSLFYQFFFGWDF